MTIQNIPNGHQHLDTFTNGPTQSFTDKSIDIQFVWFSFMPIDRQKNCLRSKENYSLALIPILYDRFKTDTVKI